VSSYDVTVAPNVATGVGASFPADVPRYTLNPVNGDPPSLGIVHDNPTDASPAVAVNTGAPGTVVPVSIAWLMEHTAPSLENVLCIAKLPVAKATSAAAPVPLEIHAHLSAFSDPLPSIQPYEGFWSVSVSAYSWPPTMVTPSRAPALPEFTKLVPQLVPTSVR